MIAFKANEKLFRAVRDKPKFWKKDGSLSSLAFKTRTEIKEKGTSVFRQDGRTLEESLNSITKILEGSIVSVTYSECQEVDISVEETDPKTFHYELKNAKHTDEYTGLTDLQSQYLADKAIIEKK